MVLPKDTIPYILKTLNKKRGQIPTEQILDFRQQSVAWPAGRQRSKHGVLEELVADADVFRGPLLVVEGDDRGR